MVKIPCLEKKLWIHRAGSGEQPGLVGNGISGGKWDLCWKLNFYWKMGLLVEFLLENGISGGISAGISAGK